MSSRTNILTESLRKNPGASKEAIADFLRALGLSVPNEYLDFMQVSNGAEGFVGDGGYVMLWPVQDIVERNQDYKVGDFAPGLLLFGSDGGGEGFAFDTRQDGMPIVSVPFVSMSLDDLWPCGKSFAEFIEYLARLNSETNG